MNTSFTEENYLKAIYHLSLDEQAVNTNAIAESLNTKAASVTDMLKRLSEKEFIHYVKYQGVTLTVPGKQRALEIIRKHRIWEVFLVDKLHFKWDEVHDLAEELEHINSTELTDRLENFLNFPRFDPHGDPIPDRSGLLQKQQLLPLSKLTVGQNGTISGVREHSAIYLQYLEKAGLVLGEKIKVEEIIAFDGSMIVNLHNLKLTVSREASNNLLIAL